MIDEQLNKLCKELGIFKGHFLKPAGLYHARYSNRIRRGTLSESEISKIEDAIRETGKDLLAFNHRSTVVQPPFNHRSTTVQRAFNVCSTGTEIVNLLFANFGIKKSKTLKIFGTTFDALSRKNQISKEALDQLKKEIKRISKICTSFKFKKE